ncbi:hypothetical protein BDZ45DRAFT_741940 [Acephala macrosclerotiorum]|nr:hypothetical protein BDZ45DRAFT_741940 [Acephala macrosclerotiorum]
MLHSFFLGAAAFGVAAVALVASSSNSSIWVTEVPTHILDPDTEMLGVIQPGGFEDLFYALSSGNYTASTLTPYDPSANASLDSAAGSSAGLIATLEGFDVYSQSTYSPRRDAINGTAPSNTT